MGSKTLQIGLELTDLDTTASSTQDIGRANAYSFGSVQVLTQSAHSTRVSSQDSTPFKPRELLIPSAETAHYSVANIEYTSEALVIQQAKWASHLGLSAFVLSPSDSTNIHLMARTVSCLIQSLGYTQLFIRVAASDKGWQQWNTIRSLANHSSKLLLAIEFTSVASEEETTVNRWMAEPVRLVVLPSSVFLTNKKNYPVLSKRHQAWLHRLMDLSVQFLVTSPTVPVISQENGGISAYRVYIEHLSKTRPPLSSVDEFAQGYDDYLQAPLQPLMDNLESATYEVFEKCPTKYQQYELAISEALKDRISANGKRDFVVCVFGAGRGPLVDCALRAADTAACSVHVIALEKNPNAIVILETKKEERWGDLVDIVHADMRHWVPNVQADILVSELLGSFGDNELSPECLDGAQKVLKPDGISIPENYTAFICPISSSKLHNDVLSYKDLEHLETPYVVKLKAINSIGGGEPVPIWKFTHPVRELEVPPLGSKNFNLHNTRFSSTRFDVKEDVLMHGIAGYFESILYRSTLLSINPSTHSPDMSSWFPIFFPIQTPIHLRRGMSVDILFWRCTDERKVWYEWCVIPVDANGHEVVGGASLIHNVGGRSSWIGL
ncbi:PRMT5 arginine-N-methyltransferase-domain-containing protein [Obelidium mucronatum]|nr:PRMT5 arginine-N-methyltransferase-domain-containing protein [Obelidium mucronatum]